MLLAFFAFSSGCGTSTSPLSGNTVTPDTPSNPDTPVSSVSFIGKEVALGLDSDNDNKPDVLDFDGVRQLYAKTDGAELSGTVPFMVWMSSLPAQNSPDVRIYDPFGNAVSATLTVYPEEQPSMILYTFTPSASGTYSVEICNADENIDTDTATNCVLFVYKEMRNSAGENSYYTRLMITDDNGSPMAEASVSEIIQLRKHFIKAHPFYLDEVYSPMNESGIRYRYNEFGEDVSENLDGNTTGEGEEDYGGYNAYVANLRSNAGIVDGDEEADAEAAEFSSAADQGVTQIEAVIYGVPYEDAYQLGTGFMATTNLQSLTESALEKFELEAPKSTDKVGTTKFTYSFIMKFGLTSTTLIIHYEEMETFYRSLPLKDYKLTEEAMMVAEEGSDAFREEYGDYFVAGY